MTNRHIHHNPLIILKRYPVPYSRIEKHFSHSHGHGGQNVNKRDTKVQLKLNLKDIVLPDEMQEKLWHAYPQGHIEVESQESRHQHSNLKKALTKLRREIEEVLI